MQPENDHAVKVLNSLIETTLDSANGYKDAAEHADNPDYKQMFAERSAKRMALSQKLQAEVRSFGGEPLDHQSLIGRAHNAFVGLRDAMSGGHSDKAVIEEVERGEDVIKKKYEIAADDAELPAQARAIVTEAYHSVKADHDEISGIKHALH